MLYGPDSLNLAKGELDLPHIRHNLSSSAHLGQPGLPESFADSKSLRIRAAATSDHILPPSADWGRFPRNSNVDLQVHTTPALQLYVCVLCLWWDDRGLPRLTSILPAHLNPVNDWIRAFSQHRQVRVRASCDIRPAQFSKIAKFPERKARCGGALLGLFRPSLASQIQGKYMTIDDKSS